MLICLSEDLSWHWVQEHLAITSPWGLVSLTGGPGTVTLFTEGLRAPKWGAQWRSCIIFHDLTQWFSVRMILSPRGLLAMSGDIFSCHTGDGATGIWRVKAGVLLNILQWTGRLIQQQIIRLQMSIMPKLRNSEIGVLSTGTQSERVGWTRIQILDSL